MPLKMFVINYDRCSVHKILHFKRCLFFMNSNIFRHSKLEILLAIPTLNEGMIETNNSAAPGLTKYAA